MLTTIPRTAAFSWGPGTQLATGSEAGLELWDLLKYEQSATTGNAAAASKKHKVQNSGTGEDFFDNPVDAEAEVEQDLEQDVEQVNGPKPRGTVRESARFINVGWGASGVIAAGLEGGELKMWDANKILAGEGTSALLASHTRPVRGLQFGPIQHHLLATGGGAGEVYIWDVTSPAGAPYAPTSGKADAEAVKWNRVVAHVLGGVGGSGAVVWDLRGKREVVRLPGGRMSDLEWCPDNATKLATACEDDGTPVVQLWDLRHARAAEKAYTHHTLGVRSLSWNIHDPSFMLSSGKDGRAVCFSSSSGEILGEVIGQGNISWSPSQPGIAAFGGDSSVKILPSQNLEREKDDVDGGEDFFDVARQEGEGLGLTKAGRWLGSHGGVSWGFGGRVVTWSQEGRIAKVRRVVWETDKVDRAKRLVGAIKKGGNEGGLKDLGVLAELFEGDVQTRVAKLLGTDETEETKEQDEAEDEDFFTQTHVDSDPYTIDTADPVTSALVKGDISRAVKACIKEERWAEALLLAMKGPADLLDETQKKYFGRESASSTSSESLVKAVVRGEISDVVKRGEGWRDVLSIVSRYAATSEPQEETFGALVEQMGERWAEEELWVLGGRLEKLVDVWGSGDDGLEGLMERVAVFRGATGFVDPDLARPAPKSSEDGEDSKPLKWKLAKLYDKYLEYVDILVGQGMAEEARVFLEFIPAGYEGAQGIRERLGINAKPTNIAAAVATTKTTLKPAYAAPISTFTPAAPTTGFVPAPAQGGFSQPGYGPAGYQQFSNGATGRAYPAGPASTSTGYAPPPNQFTNTAAPGPYSNPSASRAPQPSQAVVPPPPPKRDNAGWNDAPPAKNVPPKSKSSTPKPITNPFPNSATPYEMVRPGSRGMTSPPPPRGMVSPPPPPRAGGPPRPGSTSGFAPPPPGGRMTPQQQQPGPYGPPPTVSSMPPPPGSTFARPPPPQQGAFSAGGQFAGPPPPSGGFAPPPQQYNSPTSPQAGFAAPPPPPRGGFVPPPAGPQFIDGPGAPPVMGGSAQYAPPPQHGGYAPPQPQGSNAYAPPPSADGFTSPMGGHPGPGMGAPPLAGPGMGGPPPPSSMGGPPPRAAPKKEEKKVEMKYPPGDRSHIPERTREVFEVLDGELAKVSPPHNRDLAKRLNALFDAMNCETLKPAAEDGLRALSRAIAARDRPAALALHVEMLTRGDGDVAWMSGVKQLIVRL
ncbi:hypothetical protein CPB85DRAFT_1311040 [Mucidula mucida]|nr:hypothetical protein CPB85DRAFT_1311040 [Mucidula mucida]